MLHNLGSATTQFEYASCFNTFVNCAEKKATTTVAAAEAKAETESPIPYQLCARTLNITRVREEKASNKLIMYACIPQWTEWEANFMEIHVLPFKYHRYVKFFFFSQTFLTADHFVKKYWDQQKKNNTCNQTLKL